MPIENSDLPAYPVECSFGGDGCVHGLQTGSYSGWETGVSQRLYVAAQIASGIAHKLLPHGVSQNLTDRRTQAKMIACDALDIAERLIELEAERRKA